MKLGIVGLPNVGKSTLFNAITDTINAESANYPFCTIEKNIGVVTVPDSRLGVLSEISKSKKIIPASVEFVDIAGLVKGASKGEGLGNKFLSHIRETQAILHVVRCFDDPNIVHVEGSVDPIRDAGIINDELILADLEMITKRIERVRKQLKGDKTLQKEFNLLELIEKTLTEGLPARVIELNDENEEEIFKQFQLITAKPVIYVANVSEEDITENNGMNEHVEKLIEYAKNQNSNVLRISAKIESDLVGMEPEEKAEFIKELGLDDSGLNILIKEGYSLLGLISFFTTGEVETRAWTIRKGTNAQKSAGKIHTDIEKGFIRSETIAFDKLQEHGSMAKAKENGDLRLEGKEYIMQDGDVVHFRFNV